MKCLMLVANVGLGPGSLKDKGTSHVWVGFCCCAVCLLPPYSCSCPCLFLLLLMMAIIITRLSLKELAGRNIKALSLSLFCLSSFLYAVGTWVLVPKPCPKNCMCGPGSWLSKTHMKKRMWVWPFCCYVPYVWFWWLLGLVMVVMTIITLLCSWELVGRGIKALSFIPLSFSSVLYTVGGL